MLSADCRFRMLFPRFPMRLALILLLTAASAAAQTQTQQPQIGYKSAADAKQRETLLLRDFHPRSMLHAHVTQVERARFPVIDVHNHINDAEGIDEHMPPQQV